MAPDGDASAPKLPEPPSADDSGGRRARTTVEMPRAAGPGKPPRLPMDGKPADKPEKDDRITESIRQRLEHLVPELVKKTFAAGMGAVFSTEEGIRRIAREVSLPDVAGYIASSADGAKDKVFEVIARETREF